MLIPKSVAGLMLIGLLGYCGQSFAAFFTDPSLNWKTLSTPHFNIHYYDDEEALAHKTAILAEAVHARLSPFFNWQPNAPTEVVLTDRMDFSNGSATPVPRNTMNLIVSPPDDIGVLDDYDDWLDVLIAHEYTHILHIDKSLGFPNTLRRIFGRLIGLFPNIFQPAWNLEGIATYIETDLDKEVGRGQSSSFKTLMRLEVEHGVKSSRQVNQPMVSWPAGTTRYLYGVYFYQFVAEHYGEERIKRWVTYYSDNFIPFMINSTARNVFNKDMGELWIEFTHDLEAKFNPVIKEIKARGVIEGTNISNAGYFTGYPRALANGDVYFVQNDFESHTKIMLLRHGEQKPVKFVDINSERFDLHPQSGIVTAQIDAIKSVNFFSDLYTIDLHSGDITQITHGQRYTYATWSPDGSQIIAVQNHQGNKSLHLLSKTGELLDTLWQGNSEEVISQPDWSPDGKTIVAAVWRPGTQWNLERFTLADKTWKMLTHTKNIEAQPQFNDDGSALIFCADYGGVYNVQRMELASGQISILTNLVGGAFSAVSVPNSNELYYMGANYNGYDIYYLPDASITPKRLTANNDALIDQQPEKASSAAQYRPEKNINFDKPAFATQTNDYFGLDKLAPTSWFPYAALSEDFFEIGVYTEGSDPINRHNYSAALVYDVDNHWPLWEIDYIYDRWNPSLKLHTDRHVLITRDEFDKVSRYRNTDTHTFELIIPQLKIDRQLAYHAAISSEQESDKLVVGNTQPKTDLSDQLLGLALSYNSARFYPKSISLSDGQRFRVVAEDSDTLDSDFSGQVYTFDWRGYLNIRHRHVVATRFVVGWGTDDPNPFKLGGSSDGFGLAPPGATLFSPTDTIFNQRSYALRGYPSGLYTLTDRRMGLFELEWRFPIALIERGYTVPPVGIDRIYGKVFYNAGDAWFNQFKASELVHAAGFEVNTEFVLGYFIGVNLRIGYAHGFDERGEDQFYISAGGTY